MNPAPPPTTTPASATTASFNRYLLVFFATIAVVVGLAWAYIAAFPMAFMESGYASWTAKRTMLRQCRLGDIAFFGDSRLEAGFVPADFPLPATNFGLAAGTAIEARVAIDRALACPDRPRQVVISLAPEHFGPVSQFYWLLSIRYGFLSLGDVLATERSAAALGDSESFSTSTPDGLSGKLRDWIYGVGFPSVSFGSLVQGRIAGRWGSNHAREAEIERDRGWAAYVGGAPLRAEHPAQFIVTKLQDAELEAALGALRDNGIPAALLVMPYATTHGETDATLAAYRAHLAALAARTGATLLDPVPTWPPANFADGAHLNPGGAAAFTRSLATCLKDGRLQPPCDPTP